MVKCPKCGEENPDNSRKCSSCGADLELSDDYSNLSNLENTFKSLENEVNDLEVQNKKTLDKIEDLKKQANDLESKNKELVNKRDNLTSDYEKILKDNNDLERKINSLKRDNDNVSNENDGLRTKIEESETNTSKTKSILIICLTLIFCTALVVGGLSTLNSGHDNQEVTDNVNDTSNDNVNDSDVSSSDNTLDETNTYQKYDEEFKTFDFGGLFKMDLPSKGTLYEYDLNAGRYNSSKSWYYQSDYGEIDIYYWENENINDVISYLLYIDDKNLYSQYKDTYEVKNESNIVVFKRDRNSDPLYGVVHNNKIVFLEDGPGGSIDPKFDELKEYINSVVFT